MLNKVPRKRGFIFSGSESFSLKLRHYRIFLQQFMISVLHIHHLCRYISIALFKFFLNCIEKLIIFIVETNYC